MREWRTRWPASYDQLLARLRHSWPEERAVKEFIQILRLHLEADGKLVERAFEAALVYGCVHPDGVKQCLQQLVLPSTQLCFLSLDDRPELAHVGSQPVDLGCYEQLIERAGVQ